ncbi:Lin0512 family protein [Paenibacillus sp. NPDC058071]|uniref:Lin0512 family protein n=1 Tax=Paenibacillus sp. NPDC058071 TaxID=3346326 RepID=UPI0036DB2D42
MEKLFFIEIGMGCDLHGQDITKAAVRAVQNAIHHNSMPGLRSLLPDGSLDQMKVRVKLAVPCDRELLDLEKVKAVLPYGQVTVEVQDGGMVTTSGIVLPDKDDKNDLIYIVNASVEVGC